MSTEEDIVAELTIGDDLDEEFMKQSAYFAHWGFQHARAEDLCRKTEERVDLMFAQLYSSYKGNYPDSKENECKSYIRKHAKHRKAVQAFNKAKLDRDILKCAVRAFEIRRDMLIQLGANRRQEFDGHPTIRKQSKKDANKIVRAAVSRTRRRRK